MAIQLMVQIRRPLQVGELVGAVPRAIHDLLDLAVVPSVVIQEVNEGTRHDYVPSELIQPGRAWILRLEKRPECAFIGATDIYQDGTRVLLWVSSAAMRNELEYALIAAVALAAGRCLDEQIEDGASFFSVDNVTPWRAFLAHLRIDGPFQEPDEAAKIFGARVRGLRPT